MSKEKIIIWHEMDTIGDISLRLVEQACQEITDATGVEFELVQKGFIEFLMQMFEIDTVKEKPDIALIAQDMVNMEKARLSDVPEELSKNIEPEIWNSMKYKCVQKGIPYLQGNHALLYYNKTYFPTKPRSWEEICQLDVDNVTPMSIDLQERYWILPFLYTFSEDSFRTHTITKEGEEKTVSFIREQLRSKKVISTSANDDMMKKFLNGEIACMMNGEWKYEFLYEEMGDKLGVCMLPTIEGKQMIGTSGSFGMCFPDNSLQGKNKDKIQLFIDKMLSEDMQKRWTYDYHRLPVNMDILNDIVTAGDDSDMYDVYKQMKANVSLINEECQGDYWTRCDIIQKRCLE